MSAENPNAGILAPDIDDEGANDTIIENAANEAAMMPAAPDEPDTDEAEEAETPKIDPNDPAARAAVAGLVKLIALNATEQLVLDFLTVNASETLTAKINAGTKTLGGAWRYVEGEARKTLKGGSGHVPDATVFGWVVHYFEEDTIAEATPQKLTLPPPRTMVTTPPKPKAEKAATPPKAKPAPKPAKVKPQSKLAAKPEQMSMFNSMFGGAK